MDTRPMNTSDAALAEHECWALLRQAAFGRLAVAVGGQPDVFPVNHVVDHGTIVFRTAEGTKLAALSAASNVAFETDGYDRQTNRAWSVVVKGRASEVRGQYEQLEMESLQVAPWQAGAKPRFIRIEPQEVTGRRFEVADPSAWTSPLTGSPQTHSD